MATMLLQQTANPQHNYDLKVARKVERLSHSEKEYGANIYQPHMDPPK